MAEPSRKLSSDEVTALMEGLKTGDLSKSTIKSGKLINQVIQAASKQFDKPSKTSDAINTLILQNELKKDLDSETKALARKHTESAIALI